MLQRRYVFGPGIDQPLVQYEGSGTTDRRFMGSDERGSVISLTDGSGTLININRYDEFGKPQSTNLGRFQYTGQKWISEAGLYDYKARSYLPHLGIFAQTDPIGYAGGVNLYAYVGNDPVNFVDPLGLIDCEPGTVPVYQPSATPPKQPEGPDDPVVAGGRYYCARIVPASGTGVADGEEGPGGTVIVVRGRRTKKLSQCQIRFLSNAFAIRGLPTSHLGAVTFVSGLDSNANSLTRMGYSSSRAVTQGNTIYVHPPLFATVANLQTSTGFEEVVHTAQFAMEGGAGFYGPYGRSSIGGGILSGLGTYGGNIHEAFAKGLAKELASSGNMCPN